MKDHANLLLYFQPLMPDSVRAHTSIFKSEEVEIFAPARDSKDRRFELDPSGNITILEKESECSDGKRQRL